MKIYTEVNYEWKDDALVQTSSDSYKYSGDIALCGGGGGGGGIVKAATQVLDQTVGAGGQAVGTTISDTIEAVKDPAATIRGGPGGTLGDITDKLYGGTTKDLIEGAQGKTEEEDVAPPTLAAEEIDPEAALTAQNQKRREEQGRGAANLTAGQNPTMLTA